MVTRSANVINGVADLSGERSRLRMTGADRVDFLHGQCTNDIRKLQAGQSCYAAFLTAKGKMRGEGNIVCLPDAFILETNAGLAPLLEKFVITEDVVIQDVSASHGEWLVVGAVDQALPADAITIAHLLGTIVISSQALESTLSNELVEALRIEAGIPKWGVDMDENTIPNEAGLEKRAISYDKGCYIGQETIARIKTYGHVNRHLVQCCVEGGGLPRRGERILAEQREVGQVTSAAFSERLGKAMVLGYVRREFVKIGTRLEINQQSAEVLKVCGA